MDLSILKWDDKGLIPVIVQEYTTKEVLMLAYMNEEALIQTMDTLQATYYSRTRQSLWVKGETSGNTQKVMSLRYDCDQDSLVLQVIQYGVACHTGARSCFQNALMDNGADDTPVLHRLYALIKKRKESPVEGSYTNYLFEKGLDKILKKVGEETTEVVIAAKDNDFAETVYEVSDLIYHVIVLLVQQGIRLEDIYDELKEREK